MEIDPPQRPSEDSLESLDAEIIPFERPEMREAINRHPAKGTESIEETLRRIALGHGPDDHPPAS